MTGGSDPSIDVAREAKRLRISEQELRALLAIAWREGYLDGHPEVPATNPYNGREGGR